MICNHFELFDTVRPDMGSYPSSWNCSKCGAVIAIQWHPKFIYPTQKEEKCCIHPVWEYSAFCKCPCHKTVDDVYTNCGGKCPHVCVEMGKTVEKLQIPHDFGDQDGFPTCKGCGTNMSVPQWPPYCDERLMKPDTPKKELRKQNYEDIENLANWGTTDKILVEHFEEEREWRRTLLSLLGCRRVEQGGKTQNLFDKSDIEALRKRFL